MGHPAKAGWLIFYKGLGKKYLAAGEILFTHPLPFFLFTFARKRAARKTPAISRVQPVLSV